jgi:sugar phosphate isomerase/epimerase
VAEWLAEAGERAHGDGLTLMIEPEPICWCDSGRATARLIAQAGGVGLKINYDPGNVAWLENRDPLDEFAVVAPWIFNVHVKDLRPLTRGAGFPEWVPAGEGMIDYAAHFRGLREIGYEGPVSLEPHMDSSVEATRRCKEACERAWGLNPGAKPNPGINQTRGQTERFRVFKLSR